MKHHIFNYAFIRWLKFSNIPTSISSSRLTTNNLKCVALIHISRPQQAEAYHNFLIPTMPNPQV